MNELYNQGMCRINDGNLKEGIELLKQAAGQGYAEAQYQLAKYYFEGSGVEQDDTIAVDYLFDAAVQGHAEAQYELGRCYIEGRGVKCCIHEPVR